MIYDSADLSDSQVLKTPFGELKNLISERRERKKERAAGNLSCPCGRLVRATCALYETRNLRRWAAEPHKPAVLAIISHPCRGKRPLSRGKRSPGSPVVNSGRLRWSYPLGWWWEGAELLFGAATAHPGLCMPPPWQGVASGAGWPPAWKIKLSFPQSSLGARDKLLPAPAPRFSPLCPGGAHSSLRTREPESGESVTRSPGEALDSRQSSGEGSERRGKVCCFVMHGSRSHVAEMLHDVLSSSPSAERACSVPVFPSPANIWKHLGTCSVSVAAKEAWGRCLKPPLTKATTSPKHRERGGTRARRSRWVLDQEGCSCHLGHPSTQGGREGGRREEEEEVACILSLQIGSSQLAVPSSQAWPGLSIHPSASHPA